MTMLVPARYRERQLVGLNRMTAGEEPRVVDETLELEGLRKDQSEFPLELSLTRWEAAEGRFVTGIVRDTTERRRTKQTLQDSERLLTEAQSIAGLGSYVLDIATG